MNSQFPLPSSQTQENSGDLLLYWEIIRSWFWLIVLAAFVAGGAGAAVSYNQTKIYQASTKLLVDQANNPRTTYSDILTNERVAQTYAQWMALPSLTKETASQLGMPAELIAEQIVNVTVSPIRDSQLLEIKVQGPNRDVIKAFTQLLPKVFAQKMREVEASRFADAKANLDVRIEEINKEIEMRENAIAELGSTRNAQQELEYRNLNEDLNRLRSSYFNLIDDYESLRVTEAQSQDIISAIEEVIVSSSPVRPRLLNNILLAAIVGAMLAAGFVFAYEYLTDRFRLIDDVRRTLGSAVLGSIQRLPQIADYSPKSLVAVEEPRHPSAEALRRLRTNLRFANVDSHLRALCVTSAQAGEGKSFISANLAVVVAQSGLSVILVDADLRKPKQHYLFDMARSPGLTDVLITKELQDYSFCLQKTKVPNLRVLTAGKKAPNPTELLGSRRMHDFVEQLKEEADLVIFDTPPLLLVTDAQVLGQHLDGGVVVLDMRQTSRRMAVQAVEMLHQVNVRLFGVVVNRITRNRSGSYYSGYYGKESYYAEDEDEKGRAGTSERQGMKLKQKEA